MRAFAVLVLILIGMPSTASISRAEPSNDCKLCGDQRKACMSNYAGKTCKFEYDICMKGCRKK
jgi:hypothetical protein